MSSIYIDPQVYTGRPASTEDRLEKEIAVYDLLDRLQIPFTRVDHGVAMTHRGMPGRGSASRY